MHDVRPSSGRLTVLTTHEEKDNLIRGFSCPRVLGACSILVWIRTIGQLIGYTLNANVQLVKLLLKTKDASKANNKNI